MTTTSVAPAPAPAAARRIALGLIHADNVTFADALERIVALCDAGAGGYVVTPNVDHVCIAETDAAFRRAYAAASLSVVDGQPLVWLSRALDHALPEKISGSDLAFPLLARAAARGIPVFFLGAADGVGARAAWNVQRELPELRIAGVLAPPPGFERDPAQDHDVVRAVRASGARLVFVALGAPKQELWMHRHCDALAPAVCVGVGGTLDFLAGDVPRAPRLISRLGMEWLYRLAREPRRLAQRYLVRDRAFAGIALRMLRRRNTSVR